MSADQLDDLTGEDISVLSEAETLKIDGGIALLLPAVQAAREAASTSSTAQASGWPTYNQR